MQKVGAPRQLIHIRLDFGMVRTMDYVAADRNCFRNDAIEYVLRRGLEAMERERHEADAATPGMNGTVQWPDSTSTV